MAEICKHCGGTGRTFENPFYCKGCGRHFMGNQENKRELVIPEKYKKDFDLEELQVEFRKYTQNEESIKVLDKKAKHMKDILDGLRNNRELLMTVYLSGNTAIRDIIMRWYYNCANVVEANKKHSTNVVVLNDIDLDTDDIKTKMINSDWAGVYMTGYQQKEQLEKLSYLLAKRYMKGLPMVIIGTNPFVSVKTKNMTECFEPDLDLSLNITEW